MAADRIERAVQFKNKKKILSHLQCVENLGKRTKKLRRK